MYLIKVKQRTIINRYTGIHQSALLLIPVSKITRWREDYGIYVKLTPIYLKGQGGLYLENE